MPMNHDTTGIVIRATGSSYTVRDPETGNETECRIRGKLRLRGTRSTNPVVVGDRVAYETDARGECLITAILPRQNYVIRRSPNLSKESHIIAANIDRAAIVATLFSPETNMEFIDRFLVTCEAYKIPATILLNKIDLAIQTPEALEAFLQTYELAGYPVLTLSGTDGTGLDELRELTHTGTTLLSGNSGVGKSTLIRALVPDAEVRTGEISSYHHKGKHTTTFSQMYPLPEGGFIIDTPGIKGFGLIDIAPEELWHYFPDLMHFAPACQFYNCSHTHEPGCAVQEAVACGKIAESRYVSYLKILEEDEKYRK